MPAPQGPLLRRLRTHVIVAGTRLRRGHQVSHPDAAALVPGLGSTRFAPVPDTGHVYVAATTFAALLESAFHDAAPPAPRITAALLARWAEAEVQLTTDLRLIDLRDAELDRLGVDRSALVATAAAHYPCTRVWARALHGRHVGGRETHGLVWHSRQAELHSRAMVRRPALQELVDTHPAEVAVLWSPPARANPLRTTGAGLGRLDRGEGERYVTDIVALLGIVSQE